MIYKKFAIEIVYSIPLISDCDLLPNVAYPGITLTINKHINIVNVVKYIDKYGILMDEPTTFYTYDLALKTLELYYYMIKGNYTYNIKTVKIVEIYDDIIPPIDVMRSLKIRKIIKR